jgi:hypothetical protein
MTPAMNRPRAQQLAAAPALRHAVACALFLASSACGTSAKAPPPATAQAAEVEGEAAGTEPQGDDAPSAPVQTCLGFEMDLVNELSRAACELPESAKPTTRELKDALEIKVVANPPKVTPGGHVDITVVFRNKSKGPLPLEFVVNPLPRFEVEAYDAKGQRVDMPAKAPPGDKQPPPAGEERLARVTLAENGRATVTLGWDATKMRWAPEKLRGAAMGSGFPRAPAGPLPKGKYTLRIVTPLASAFEGAEREVSAPKIDVEVEK